MDVLSLTRVSRTECVHASMSKWPRTIPRYEESLISSQTAMVAAQYTGRSKQDMKENSRELNLEEFLDSPDSRFASQSIAEENASNALPSIECVRHNTTLENTLDRYSKN